MTIKHKFSPTHDGDTCTLVACLKSTHFMAVLLYFKLYILYTRERKGERERGRAGGRERGREGEREREKERKKI